MPDERAISPVVGKALEAALVVLYIGMLTAALYGSAVPDYRTAAGEEVGERVLAKVAHHVQQAVPPNATAVRVAVQVDVPRTIRGRPYTIRANGRSLALDHPNDDVTATATLAVPETVGSIRGNWSSRDASVVTVRRSRTGLAVRLSSGGGGG